MQNTCPNPNCGAMYNLTAQHVGRSFACKKCGATLVVSASGLEIAGPPPVVEAMGYPSADEPPLPSRRPRTGPGAGAFFAQAWERIRSDAATWVFGAGAFFVILCLFFPLLDHARVLRREAKLAARDRQEQRLNAELRRKEAELRGKGEDPDKVLKKEKEEREKAYKRWQEEEKPRMEQDVDDARDTESAWRYWYHWGMMWGFLFLAYAALGYLTPTQATIRRVVGSIIICAMMLLIFIRFVIESR